jgi:hypothetical protein
MDIEHLLDTKSLRNTSNNNNITTKKHGSLFFNKGHFMEAYNTLMIE